MAKRAAGLVIFRRLSGEIQYLMLKASYGEFHWTPPKGHSDSGEDDYTTALRETKEEAGYSEGDLKIFKDINYTLNYNVKNIPKVVVYWLAELKDVNKDVLLSDEHTEFKWLAKDEAKDIVVYKDTQELIEAFHQKIVNELS